jgi:hypothetical protein
MKEDEVDWASITNWRQVAIHIKFRCKTEEEAQLGRCRNIEF